MALTETIPRTPTAIRAWLKGTENGRALLAMLTAESLETSLTAKCRECESIRPYPKVLVVLRKLGRFPGAEVYTEEGASVRLLEMPDVSSNDNAGRLVEEYMELKLPKSWQGLMGLAAKRIQSEVFRGVSLSDTLRYSELRADIETLRKPLNKEKES